MNIFEDFTEETSMAFSLASPVEEEEDEESDLITDVQYHYILMGFMCLWLLLALAGIVTNAINIVTFVRMGLEDSVTISFCALSSSDLVASFIGVFHATTAVLRVIQKEENMLFGMDPFAFAVFCAHYRRMFYDVSVLITTYLAVQRCCCVAMPLHFKGVFTRSRTVCSLAGVCAFSVACYFPMFVTHGLTLGVDPVTNMTRYLLWMSENREDVLPITEVITAIILPTSTQIIVVFCLVVMVFCLNKSSRFREGTTAAIISLKDISKQRSDNLKVKSTHKDNKILTKDMASVQGSSSGVSKERQVIKAVGLVSFVFVVCNTPKIVTANTRQFLPDFDVAGKLFNVYLVGNCIRLTFELFNSAVNLIIYYKFNSKYRKMFHSMILCSKSWGDP